MQRALIGLGIAALAAAIVFLSYANQGTKSDIIDLRGEREVTIVLHDAGFEPRNIRIDTGTTVTFSTTRPNRFWPASNTHPSHDIFAEFDPKRPLEPSETWSFTFDRVGSWGYHDHVRSYYTGVIYVE